LPALHLKGLNAENMLDVNRLKDDRSGRDGIAEELGSSFRPRNDYRKAGPVGEARIASPIGVPEITHRNICVLPQPVHADLAACLKIPAERCTPGFFVGSGSTASPFCGCHELPRPTIAAISNGLQILFRDSQVVYQSRGCTLTRRSGAEERESYWTALPRFRHFLEISGPTCLTGLQDMRHRSVPGGVLREGGDRSVSGSSGAHCLLAVSDLYGNGTS
jgi:hypothetical protein